MHYIYIICIFYNVYISLCGRNTSNCIVNTCCDEDIPFKTPIEYITVIVVSIILYSCTIVPTQVNKNAR